MLNPHTAPQGAPRPDPSAERALHELLALNLAAELAQIVAAETPRLPSARAERLRRAARSLLDRADAA